MAGIVRRYTAQASADMHAWTDRCQACGFPLHTLYIRAHVYWPNAKVRITAWRYPIPETPASSAGASRPSPQNGISEDFLSTPHTPPFPIHRNIPRLMGEQANKFRVVRLNADVSIAFSKKVSLPLFQHELIFFPGNFKAVGTRCLTGAGNKHCSGATGILQKRIDLVFHLNRVIPQSDVGRDTYWKPHKPLRRIDAALVDGSPAPLPFPRGAPGAGLIVRLSRQPVTIQCTRRMSPSVPSWIIDLMVTWRGTRSVPET